MKLTQDMTMAAWDVLATAEVKRKELPAHRRLFLALKAGACKHHPATEAEKDEKGNVTKAEQRESWERAGGVFQPTREDLAYFQTLYFKLLDRGVPGQVAEIWAALGDEIEAHLQPVEVAGDGGNQVAAEAKRKKK